MQVVNKFAQSESATPSKDESMAANSTINVSEGSNFPHLRDAASLTSSSGASKEIDTSKEPLRPQSEIDEDSSHMCRVCRSDDGDLYYPCLCTGSIKYVHQECLLEWLKYSKKEVCELCNHKYSFQPIYRADMPTALPVSEIIRGIGQNIAKIVKVWLVYTMVLFAWLGIVPLTAARIFNAVFAGSFSGLVTLPLRLFNTQHMIADCAKGTILLALFVLAFISLVWLREQIVHGGPQVLREWLNLDEAQAEEEGEAGTDEADDEAEQPEGEDGEDEYEDGQHVDYEDDDDETASEIEESADEEGEEASAAQGEHDGLRQRNHHNNHQAGDAQPAADAQAPQAQDARAAPQVADAGAQAGGGDWRDWDRIGDELTWQRLLGLDGSLVFLEHVFWVISLNTVFTILFAFSPYKLGGWLIGMVGLTDSVEPFPSAAALLTGYLAFSILTYILHRIAALLKFKMLYRLLGISFLVLKVFLLVLVEIGIFPIVCGWWMDLCSLPLFGVSLSTRITSFSNAPTSSIFLHWMIGMVYVFYSASFVLMLREVLRPGVLWFMRNLNDPEFNPIQEMIELPVTRHVRRLAASTSLFFMAILLVVYVPLRLIRIVVPAVLPYNLSLTAETPMNELSLELLILQVILPALLEQSHARVMMKEAVRVWCRVVGKFLLLDRYLLAEDAVNQNVRVQGGEAAEPPPPPPPDQELNDPVLAGGGLAAEHQALLLVREPVSYLPYQRPPMFPLRIVVLLACVSFSATVISCGLFIIPVTIGRMLIRLITGYSNVHELYTAFTGFYVCWLALKTATIAMEWLPRGGAQLARGAAGGVMLGLRVAIALAPFGVIIPMLIGTVLQFVVLAPMRVSTQQTAINYWYHDWAMGFLQMKIAGAMILMGPDWWLKTALEQSWNDGVRNLRLGHLYKELIIPVAVSLSLIVALPYAIARLCLFFLNATIMEQIVFLRYSYPASALVVVCVAFVVWQFQKLRALAQAIRNEKYLVGTQLVNYER